MAEALSGTQLIWDMASRTFVMPSRQRSKFLKGPVPWDWIERAARLPGKALVVGLALWRLSGATKSTTIRLGNSEMSALGVDRSAKSRALKALAAADLISIDQKPGKMPVVTLLPVDQQKAYSWT